MTLSINGTMAGQAVTDQTTITPFTSVAITDDAGQIETVTVTLSAAGDGALSNLGDGSYDAVAGVYTATGDAATVTADLNGLVFTPVTGTPGVSVTTTFTIGDSDTALVSASDTTTSVITTGASPSPTIIGTVAGQAVTDQTPVAPFNNVAIADIAGQTETVTVSLSDPTSGVLSNLGDGTYDSVGGVYTATGSAATVTTDLNGLVFTPAAGIPGQSVTTTFTISDTDSASVSTSDTTTSVVATASMPTIAGTSAGQTITYPATGTPFSGVTITDAIGQTETVTVSLSDPTSGVLSNLGDGSFDSVGGVYTATGSAATVTADLDGLVFTPAVGIPGQSVTTTFTISDTDFASVSTSDTTTSVVATVPLPIPTIAGTTAGQTVTDPATGTPFSGVTITDAIGQTETVTVTVSNTANGSLSNLGDGVYDAVAGTYTATGSADAVTADLVGLVFTPAAGTSGQSVTTTFTISDVNSASGTTTDSTTSVIASDPIAPATITGSMAEQGLTDQATIAPFTGVMISDTGGRTEHVTVTLSAAANGSLNNLGGGSYDAATGVYTADGSAAVVTADLQGLVFTPTAGEVVLGQMVATGFTIADTNGGPATATDTGTSVIATAVAPPPRTFTITDTTTGITTTTDGTAYSGPVAGVQSEYVTTTSSNLAITATAPNMFIHTGSGNDAIDVSRVNGTNVLDGSTGSNFLVGGTGFDTFYLDDRGPTADLFSTVVNFHAGDNATVWGVTTSDFHLNLFDGQGAAGYTGLDFSFTAPGHQNANVVLSGFSTADLSNGRLSVTYGTTAGGGGAPGSTYMMIHAN